MLETGCMSRFVLYFFLLWFVPQEEEIEDSKRLREASAGLRNAS